jgi:hypothetical protein
MPEGLATEDGTALGLDPAEQEFARAMAAPEPDEPEHPAPPKRQQPAGDAPYGYKADGTPKKAAGRPRKARVTDAPPAEPEKPARGAKAAEPKPSYAQPLTELTSALWMVLAAAPVPPEGLRVKIRAQAKVLKANQPGLVKGLDIMAQNNGTIRRGVEALTMGSAGWVLPAVMAVSPFAVQTAQLWRMDPADLAGLAEETEKEWAAEFEAMQQAMGVTELQDEQEFTDQEAPA